ncbi:ABC transporter permease [Shewanella sp. Isolate11]|uniref:ABC transporter permease n=1 Tax=Shewanella sp. Isolate11 TaxID=2908530 RepID=UPI001EFD3B4C|nr:ABC transporter permease [Shewanella sp. Isolate11]MCG9695629.1 ABC transporter permease [Shewanella sp. Isolate11]
MNKPKKLPSELSILRGTQLTLKVFWAHYHQAPLQAGAIIIGIILAVSLLIGVRATNENAINSYSNASELLSQQAKWLITANRTTYLDQQRYFELKQLGIHQSLAVLQGWLSDDKQQRWQISGSDLIAAMSTVSNSSDNSSAKNTSQTKNTPSFQHIDIPLGDMLAGKPLVLMSRSQAQQLTGNSLTLAGQKLEVIAVDDSYQQGDRLLMDISLAQQLLAKPQQLSYIAIFSDIGDRKSQLETWLADRAQLSQNDQGASMKALTNSFHLNLTAMSLLAFIVGLFIAYNGVRYSLLKRKRLLTQLQQQGIMKPSLMLALAAELLLLVLLGSLLGFILGLELSYWLQPMVSVTLEQLYGAQIFAGHWRWQWLAQATLLTFVAALLACSSLFIELLRQPLAQSSDQFSQQRHALFIQQWQIRVAIALALIASIVIALSQNYTVTMAMLGLVILSFPLALPWLLQRLVGLFEKLTIRTKIHKGLIGYLLGETRELIPPLSLAMMAMLLALTANISMNSLVGSFEITLKQWLDSRLHADLYLRPSQNKMADIEAYLQQDSQVKAIYKQWQTTTHFKNAPTHLLTRDPQSIQRTSIIKQAQDQLWPRFFAANANGEPSRLVLVSEPFAIKHNLKLGDNIKLAPLDEQPLTIAAIYYDYGNPYGEVLIPLSLWQQAGLGKQPLSLAIGYGGNLTEQQLDRLSQQLQQKFALPEALIYSQAKIKAQAIAMFKRTFSITQVLNSLTLLVAAIGLFSACYLLTQARLAPIARLYTLGVNRRQLGLMVVSQMLFMVLLTCLVALPMGAILGYLLINKVTLQAFGWSIAMVWDWLAYFEVVLLAIVTSAIAVAFPLYQQTKRPLISSLQREVL